MYTRKESMELEKVLRAFEIVLKGKAYEKKKVKN